MHIAVIDVGNPTKNLGWAIAGENTQCGYDLDECVARLGSALRAGPLALGFESPLFVPARQDVSELARSREGECVGGINRPWSAAAGAASLATGIVIMRYVLNLLRQEVPEASATLDHVHSLKGSTLLLFEAFVTNTGRKDRRRHIDDALTAVRAFRNMLKRQEFRSAIAEKTCFSLAGAVLLDTGWASDLSMLRQPCLVVKASVARRND
jgi:hypothetical protein